MAAVEIPWSRIVTWSPSSAPFGLTPSGVLTLNRVLPGVLTTDTAVPAGSASIRVAELPGGGELGRYGYALRTFGGALLVPTNLDGATLNAGYAYPRHNPAVWTPEWNTPGGDIVLETRLWSNALGLHAAKLSGLIVGPSTVGDLQYWDSLDLATTVAAGYVFPTWPVSGVDGPWVSAFASGTVLAVRKTWTGTKTITVPLRQTGSTMTATLTAPGGATLLSAGGATVSGSTLTIPPGVQCVPKWEATGGATLTLTKGAPAIVASYAPVFVETPVVPPTPPTITKLIPTVGPDTGGTLVDVIGTDLTGATAVDFGGTAGTGLTVDPSGNLATVTSPAHTAGPYPVTITTPAGVSNAETFTFEAPPVVTVPVIYAAYPLRLCADAPDNPQVLIPIIFPITDVVSAEVGGVDAGVGGVLDIGGGGGSVFISPPSLSPGTYDLILTNSAGSSDPYPIEYVDCEGCPPDPTVVAVFPGAALPGATIQLVGTNLTGATVTMCGDPVAIVSNDGNIITVVVPPGCPDGPATITVTTPDGETTVDFTVLKLLAPVIDLATPDEGYNTGGGVVMLSGRNFLGVSEVTFDGLPGVNLFVPSDDVLIVTAPPHAAGQVSILVTSPSGVSLPFDWTYIPTDGPPDIYGIVPSSGPKTGGTEITLIGKGFVGLTSITIEGKECFRVTVLSDTEATCVTTSNPVGSAQVIATNSKGASPPANFTYFEAEGGTGIDNLGAGGIIFQSLKLFKKVDITIRMPDLRKP